MATTQPLGPTFPYEADDVSASYCSPAEYNNLLSWDCYRFVCGEFFAYTNDNDVLELDIYNDSIKLRRRASYLIIVQPSQSLYRVHFDSVDRISVGDCVNLVEVYFQEDVSRYNSSIRNDFNNPLDCPPDVNLLD